MKIGFFGGSFNPPSYIHINLAKMLIDKKIIDKVVFVPVGDYYEKANLIKAEHRINMLKLAIGNEKNLELEKIATDSNIKLYASDTFNLIGEKYKNDEIYFIMGSDNYRKMPTWKNYEEIINTYKLIVIERERKQIRKSNKKNVIELIPEEYYKIDSSMVREMIKKGKDVSEYINKKVYKYIIENGLYKNEE